MRRSESCANCFFHEDDEEQSDTVTCHFDVPRFVRVFNDGFPTPRAFVGAWPSIRKTEWCGKWKAMEKPPEAVAVRVTSTIEK